MQARRKLRVLLVDDDEVDRMAVSRGLERSGIDAEIRIARDGLEALDILRGNGTPQIAWPYIILLDLNMPRLDGLGFLDEIRADKDLRRSVVIVLSTSELDADKKAAYDASVAAYVVKRDAGRNFQDLVTLLDSFWSVVSLPEN